jgi:hypothetical protein
LELAAIVHALKMWRHYLLGRIFELSTNHCGLKYLFGQQTLNFKKSTWLEFLKEYDFNIKHIGGKENKVSDTLSRRVHEMHATTIIMYKSDLKDKILEVAKYNQRYVDINKKNYSKVFCSRKLMILS